MQIIFAEKGSTGMIKWWITTNGTLKSDGAPTVGWHNGNIIYSCDIVFS